MRICELALAVRGNTLPLLEHTSDCHQKPTVGPQPRTLFLLFGYGTVMRVGDRVLLRSLSSHTDWS